MPLPSARASAAHWLLPLALLLGGCAPAARDAGAPAATPATTPAAAPATATATAPAAGTGAATTPVARHAPGTTEGRTPAIGDVASRTADDRCTRDADCEVKDVGSCCGYQPRCLNHAARADPAAARARCAAEGRVGTCGFREVAGCQCVSGRCAARAAPGADVVQ